MPTLAPPLGLPPAIAGILDLAGRAIAVIRLDRLFGLPVPAPRAYNHLILMRTTDAPLAFLVDRVTDVLSLRAPDMAPVEGSGTLNDCVVGEIVVEDTPVHVLSADRVLSEHERRALADFQDMEQRRLDDLRVQP